MNITHIVVHYSATFPDQEVTAADIDSWHKARGWKGIGYHWFIRRNGKLEAGRPETQVGAHVGGQNTGKIGICWAGGIERSNPTVGVNNMAKVQEETLLMKLGELTRKYPGAKVVGHRDLAATQCPGFDVASWWEGQNKAPQPLPDLPVRTPDLQEPTPLSWWQRLLTFLGFK